MPLTRHIHLPIMVFFEYNTQRIEPMPAFELNKDTIFCLKRKILELFFTLSYHININVPLVATSVR